MRMRWAGHVASMDGMRNAYKILIGNCEGRDHSTDIDIDE